MTEQALMLERGQMTVDMATALEKADFTLERKATDFSVCFTVRHAGHPGWSTRVRIQQAEREGSLVNVFNVPGFVEGQYTTYDKTKRGVARVVDRVTKMLEQAKFQGNQTAALEQRAAQFEAQKEQELAGVRLPDWANVTIRLEAESAGRYRVSFDEGSPLERLTGPQVRALMAVLAGW